MVHEGCMCSPKYEFGPPTNSCLFASLQCLDVSVMCDAMDTVVKTQFDASDKVRAAPGSPRESFPLRCFQDQPDSLPLSRIVIKIWLGSGVLTMFVSCRIVVTIWHVGYSAFLGEPFGIKEFCWLFFRDGVADMIKTLSDANAQLSHQRVGSLEVVSRLCHLPLAARNLLCRWPPKVRTIQNDVWPPPFIPASSDTCSGFIKKCLVGVPARAASPRPCLHAVHLSKVYCGTLFFF